MGRAPAPTPWHNWARTAHATPRSVAHPRDLGELVAAVQSAGRAGLRVRAVGGGHSFTPAAVTDGVQLRLDALDTLERVAPRPDGTAHVTVGAGIRLHALNAALAAHGLAMRNLGDIDKQSIAGAISTGTHGTGARLGGLATQVVGARVVLADGSVVETSPTRRPELFELARLGLGCVGVLAAVTLEVVPAFRLEAREEPWPLERVVERLDGPDGLVESNDHFEFYWFPHTRRALTKRNNRVPDDDVRPLHPVRSWIDDELLSNAVFAVTNRIATLVPPATPGINAVSARALAPRSYTAPSAEVFVSPRRVRFREMEYAVPRESVVDVLREVDAWIRSSGERLPFPVEVRFAAQDDLWLSTAHGRPTAYVAVHQNVHLPYARYFRAVEAIAAQVGGRPHWGKLHWRDSAALEGVYPRFADARRVRAQADPGGTFTNPYLDRVLGPVPGGARAPRAA
ncbi:D-arabinono-1,4-lactone oxidase [Cellulomonas fimi]|uniref:FAD-linked oxidoreductase n=1 Tax=Cellulomonas fimi (strain ATCC 484 / DSM 20113 / JCM 1341 / CCUG 24087 / LMG 16345 / NBRC 15513 / NCIMB 8980 / NCTC 7547 / NRS-133) TaxID=590998 RepID=F4GY75_CELFA|nr:D-arabinono-1,4-lactone oxidase [Cellulomonas fimi]AEE44743.1 FAD-linked oxidoreductase [Cellulomonas fimi ATCC 484]NNH06116.1 FAD-binding protein [Cellulomonas fimi]VEH27168.1 Xylitol oxidase [Cellulomonas fimi]